MEIRFENHAHLHRVAARAGVGGMVAAMVAPAPSLVQAAIAGGVLTVAFWPASNATGRSRRIVAGVSCALAAVLSALDPSNGWVLAAAGALFGLFLAAVRDDAARESGAQRPAFLTIGAAVTACAAVIFAAGTMLPELVRALDAFPGWLVSAAAGGLAVVWGLLAATPLHLAAGADPVEQRLGGLRPSMTADLRPLVERAVSARREALSALPEGARGDLRTLLDALALAALDLAERAGSLGRAAPPGAEDELARRVLQLTRSAETSDDANARGSYQRAAEALSGQLEHLRRVRRARERAVARLHEEVAHLERARFALSLLRGSDVERSAIELELLHDRLQLAAAPLETDDEVLARIPARAAG